MFFFYLFRNENIPLYNWTVFIISFIPLFLHTECNSLFSLYIIKHLRILLPGLSHIMLSHSQLPSFGIYSIIFTLIFWFVLLLNCSFISLLLCLLHFNHIFSTTDSIPFYYLSLYCCSQNFWFLFLPPPIFLFMYSTV